MLKPGRFEKTPERNLADLDDHIYFLKEDFAKLIGGDGAYVKKVAGELRTLICLSSGTEGLLWRVIEELGVDDGLDLQAPLGIDRNNPLTHGLSFMLIPVWRAGHGPARFATQRISLKKFIKEYEALYYDGVSHTHERLISAIGQQMGLSHESEDVAPHLVDLSGVAMSDRPALADFLITDAEFTLEIGDRVLGFAATQGDFTRKGRPSIVIPTRSVVPFEFNEDDHFFGRNTALGPAGSQLWVIPSPGGNWEDDGLTYDLGTLHCGKLVFSAIKHADSTLEMTVCGFGPTPLVKKLPIIPSGKSAIALVFTWQDGVGTIYIDGHR